MQVVSGTELVGMVRSLLLGKGSKFVLSGGFQGAEL